jgi:hypothetical protein
MKRKYANNNQEALAMKYQKGVASLDDPLTLCEIISMLSSTRNCPCREFGQATCFHHADISQKRFCLRNLGDLLLFSCQERSHESSRLLRQKVLWPAPRKQLSNAEVLSQQINLQDQYSSYTDLDTLVGP